jgi:hypothetical protein
VINPVSGNFGSYEMRTQEYCKEQILREFGKWKDREHPDELRVKEIDALMFFAEIQRDNPGFLNFRYSRGDKWQKVKSWLREARHLI